MAATHSVRWEQSKISRLLRLLNPQKWREDTPTWFLKIGCGILSCCDKKQ
jgi:hypothetical protein